MPRIDRLLFRPFSRWFAATALTAAGIGAGAGCTLITDVDRSKIPAAEVVPPDPPAPQGDAGEEPVIEGDAGGAPDADAGGTPEADAGEPPAPDAGEPVVGDAG